MTCIPSFWGNGQGAIGPEIFLEAMDGAIAARDNDWDHVAEFESKLGGTTHDWFDALPKSLHSIWSLLQELFIMYFIKCIGDSTFCTKCSRMLSMPLVFALIDEVSCQSTSFPVYHVLVEEIDDPIDAFHTVLEELQSSSDTEKIFRILWDAAQMIGSNNCTCGDEFNQGFAMGRSQGQAEGKKEEGLKLGQGQGKRPRKDMVDIGVQVSEKQFDVSTDTSDLSNPVLNASTDTLDLNATADTSKPESFTTAPAIVDWAEDSAPLPTAPLIPPPVPAARNITVLHQEQPSGSPFRSLQCHTRRTCCSHHQGSKQQLDSFHFNTAMQQSMPTPMPPPSPYQNSPLITCRHPPGIGPGKPGEVFQVSSPSPVPESVAPVQSPGFSLHVQKPILDWTRDLHLVQLSQLLGDLGWVHWFG